MGTPAMGTSAIRTAANGTSARRTSSIDGTAPKLKVFVKGASEGVTPLGGSASAADAVPDGAAPTRQR
eukprot:646229-Pleurochrysis_carterae.AAC.1